MHFYCSNFLELHADMTVFFKYFHLMLLTIASLRNRKNCEWTSHAIAERFRMCSGNVCLQDILHMLNLFILVNVDNLF